MTNITRLFLTSTLLVASLQAADKPQAPKMPPPKADVYIVPQAQDLAINLKYPAEVVASKKVQVVSRVIGILEKKYFKEGDLVKEGDLLYKIEAITIIDVLRRAGIEVVTVALSKRNVKGAHGIAVKADEHIDEIISDTFDMIVLPGGIPGAEHLRDNNKIISIISDFKERNKPIGAICAAPIALNRAGVLDGKYTCYPSFETQISKENYIADQKVVISNNVITSRGPGTAICFALSVVKHLVGEGIYKDLKKGLLADFC